MIDESPTPDLGRIADRAITEVLGTQFKFPAMPSSGVNRPIETSAEAGLVGSVRLKGRRFTGWVHVQLPEALATKLTALLLGRGAADEGETTDMTGELCNMIAGRVAVSLAAAGYPSSLCTPTVSRGPSAFRAPLRSKIYRSDWTCEGHLLTFVLQFTFNPT
jgi:CheY-specific phosphatase CheX